MTKIIDISGNTIGEEVSDEDRLNSIEGAMEATVQAMHLLASAVVTLPSAEDVEAARKLVTTGQTEEFDLERFENSTIFGMQAYLGGAIDRLNRLNRLTWKPAVDSEPLRLPDGSVVVDVGEPNGNV